MKEFDFEKRPIVEIANEIIMDAVKKNASDIHFDPYKDKIIIRIRIDGILANYGIIPGSYKRNMVSRIKMIAGMNIMETRLPQDGAIKSRIGKRMLDLRVSSLPTNNGEKVVIRILDYSKSLNGLNTLGFSKDSLEKIDKMTKVPNGIILVTGATGTGKSTTVYSILQKMNTEDVNIITVEDPIEMDIAGVNQVQVQSEIGLTFANVLRSILRQDPNIIMIGEIRDDETAKIAVRASITGHIVLSTIHTNNSLNTIERLTDMDVERYLLGSALTGIVSQKLARKLCPHCKKKRKTTDYEKNVFKKALNKDIREMYEANPNGCDKCYKGYKDRIAVLEVLLINDDIRDAITNGFSKQELRRLVYKADVITLLQDGLTKVIEGETSFEEILKVVDLENDLSTYEEDSLKASMNDIEKNTEREDKKEKFKNAAVDTDEEFEILNVPDDNTNDNRYVIEDYSSLIPSNPENLKKEIPHDTPPISNNNNDEIEFFDI